MDILKNIVLGEDSRYFSAEAQNVQIAKDASGNIIEDIEETTPTSYETLSHYLINNSSTPLENIIDGPAGKHSIIEGAVSTGTYEGISYTANIADGAFSHAEGFSMSTPGDNPHELGWLEPFKNGSFPMEMFFAISDDTTPDHSKVPPSSSGFYIPSIQIVDSPSGNPSGQRYFESTTYEGKTIYILSLDTEVVSGKTYYSVGLPIISANFDNSTITTASGNFSHVEGVGTTASGNISHAEGLHGQALGFGSHVEGGSLNESDNPHILGLYEYEDENNIFILTQDTSFDDNKTYYYPPNIVFPNGDENPSSMRWLEYNNNYFYTEDTEIDNSKTYYRIIETNNNNNNNNIANAPYAHAEGLGNIANGIASHIEGSVGIFKGTIHPHIANGDYSHAEGICTTSNGIASHTEGQATIASGNYSHAEGSYTIASELSSHAEGSRTTASGYKSHAEGTNTIASGYASHVGGSYTIAQGENQTVIGKYNIAEGYPTSAANTDYAFIIGNGTADNARSNAFGVKWNGNIVFADGHESTPAELYNNGSTLIAPTESTSTASQAYTIGDQFIYNGLLTEATAIISQGDTIIVNSSGNAKLADCITDQLVALKISIDSIINDITASY